MKLNRDLRQPTPNGDERPPLGNMAKTFSPPSALRRGILADMSATKRPWSEINDVSDSGPYLLGQQSATFQHTHSNERSSGSPSREGTNLMRPKQMNDHHNQQDWGALPAATLLGADASQIAAAPQISRKVKACAACRKQKVFNSNLRTINRV